MSGKSCRYATIRGINTPFPRHFRGLRLQQSFVRPFHSGLQFRRHLDRDAINKDLDPTYREGFFPPVWGL